MGLLQKLDRLADSEPRLYSETNTSLKRPWTHAFWLQRYGSLSKTAGPVQAIYSYPFFFNGSGELEYYSTDGESNYSLIFLGDPRRTGKSTGLNYAFYQELIRGAKGIMFDPKGEYPITKWPGVNYVKVGIGDDENPVKLKPSLLTEKDWTQLTTISDLAPIRDKNAVQALCIQAANKLERTGQACSIDGLEAVVLTGEFGGYGKKGSEQSVLKMAKIFFNNLRSSDMFSEEEGLDFRTFFNDWDCLIFDMSRDDAYIDLIAGHIFRQLNKFKKLKPTVYKPNPFFHMKLIVGGDEVGQSDYGICTHPRSMSCLSDIKKTMKTLPAFNVICMFATQYPQDVSPTVLGATVDLFLGCLQEENTIRKLAKNSNMADWELQDVLPRLKKGQFMLVNKDGRREIVQLNIPSEFIKKRRKRKV